MLVLNFKSDFEMKIIIFLYIWKKIISIKLNIIQIWNIYMYVRVVVLINEKKRRRKLYELFVLVSSRTFSVLHLIKMIISISNIFFIYLL
jgi:hypothetical protein